VVEGGGVQGGFQEGGAEGEREVEGVGLRGGRRFRWRVEYHRR